VSEATLDGIFAVKLPVSDLAMSRAWYEQVLGFQVEMEFPDQDGVVRGVAGHVPGEGETRLALREDPDVAKGVAGFNLVNFAIPDRASAEAWAARLDDLGVEHSPVIEATIGWIVVFHDPDGIELHLYSRQHHHADHAGRRGYGRPVAAPN
jgi:catechol 2,3-dioxygenase-like lactoylglutathione lyase family enzyme